jgi:predicted DNA-binding transcriptional regulator AlpA
MAGLFAAKDAVNTPQQGDRLACGRNSAFMDSCQLIRKETKMQVVHLNQKQLAARWSISEATLERWRSEGIGPKFLKLGGRVLYRQADIEAYEESCLATSTKPVEAQVGAG